MFSTIDDSYMSEALLGVIGIRDIWVKNYRDTGYLGGKLKGYGIFLKRFWDIEVIIFQKNQIRINGIRDILAKN